MKILRSIIITLFFLYALLFVGTAYLFQAAEQHKDKIAAYLCYITGRDVTIESIATGWKNLNPVMLISNVHIEGDNKEQAALAIDSLALEIDAWTMMRLWPQFQELSIAAPKIEIVSLAEGGLQIAGIKFKHGKRKGKMSRRAINWFLNHRNIDVVDGEVIWYKQSGKIRHYQDIAFIFRKAGQRRQIKASAVGEKGKLAFVTDLNGDILGSKEWDATFQLLDGDGVQMLTSEDLQISVERGRGLFHLSQLDSERVTDILRIAGVGSEFEKWLFDAQLQGLLLDVTFSFSGPLLKPDSWGLTAQLSGIELLQTEQSPSFQNLSGQLDVTEQGGRFDFLLEDSLVQWSKYLDYEHVIDEARGQFEWDLRDDSVLRLRVINGIINNKTVTAKNLNVSMLKYPRKPFYMDAKGQLDISSLKDVFGFFPNIGKGKFKKWWGQAMLSGSVQNSNLHYQGWLSQDARENKQMKIHGDGYFKNVILNYGPKYGWPKVVNADGRFGFDGQSMSFYPKQAWVEQAVIHEAKIDINNLFSRKRELSIEAKSTAPLKDVMAFLLQGPLIRSEEIKNNPPLIGLEGIVDSVMSISVPLSTPNDATVTGTANIRDGLVEISGGVPISEFSALVDFTESSAHSENMSGQFLGGDIQGKLTTVEAGRPPQLELTASGVFDPQYLLSWLGAPLVSVMNGQSKWQGKINIKEDVTFIDVNTDLQGIEVDLPEPEFKAKDMATPFELQMALSNKQNKSLDFTYGDMFKAKFKGNLEKQNTFFDYGELNYGLEKKPTANQRGIHINVSTPAFDADDWIEKIVDICEIGDSNDTEFVDAMRSIHISSPKTELLGRNFADLDVKVVSKDGRQWRGNVNGKNAKGKLHFLPQANPSTYKFDLSYLNFPASTKTDEESSQQKPTDFPAIYVLSDKFVFMDKDMGSLLLEATPEGQSWKVNTLQLNKPGVVANVTGEWKPHKELGSQSLFEIEVDYGRAGEALEDFGFSDFMANGGGRFVGSLNWQGGVGDFTLDKLNGSYDLKVKNGRLLKIEPKSGKLLGLLNLNAVSRRLRLDFSDIFEQGLEFDRMESVGKLVNGDMILEGAYIISPSVFIQSEGRIGLAKEDYDMQVKVSPEFGGNIALFTALANPAAGALVFLTQKLFRKELSSVSHFTYEVLGPWKSPEITKIDNNSKK